MVQVLQQLNVQTSVQKLDAKTTEAFNLYTPKPSGPLPSCV